MTRYGNQEGAKKGYNPKKRGRNSHHPLIAFVAEVRMAVNFWLRSGNAYTIGSYIVKNGNGWFEGLWASTNLFSWPFVVSKDKSKIHSSFTEKKTNRNL
jgi:hypothetical protein